DTTVARQVFGRSEASRTAVHRRVFALLFFAFPGRCRTMTSRRGPGRPGDVRAARDLSRAWVRPPPSGGGRGARNRTDGHGAYGDFYVWLPVVNVPRGGGGHC